MGDFKFCGVVWVIKSIMTIHATHGIHGLHIGRNKISKNLRLLV